MVIQDVENDCHGIGIGIVLMEGNSRAQGLSNIRASAKLTIKDAAKDFRDGLHDARGYEK